MAKGKEYRKRSRHRERDRQRCDDQEALAALYQEEDNFTDFTSEEDKDDRISALPEDAILHILSFLSAKEALALSTVSKAWRWVSSSCSCSSSIQSFDQSLSRNTTDFTNSVHHSLSRFCSSDVKVKPRMGTTLVVRMETINGDLPKNVDRWLDLVSKNNLKVLYLHIAEGPEEYPMSAKAFAASRSLTTLNLSRCRLPNHILNETTQFDTLHDLYLTRVRVSDNTIRRLVSCCPNILNLRLLFCTWFKNLRLSNLGKLKNFSFHGNAYGIDSIVISDTPALRAFHFYLRGSLDWQVFVVPRSKLLEELQSHTIPFPHGLRLGIVSNFPFLESSSLVCCPEYPKLSSQQPEKLFLPAVHSVSHATVDTSNLQSPKSTGFSASLESSLISVGPSRLTTITISVHEVDTSWFLKMRTLLGKLSLGDIVLSLTIRSQATGIFNPKELRDIPIPPICQVKNLNLTVDNSPSDYSSLVDGILWSCHPETISAASVDRLSGSNIFALELQAQCEKHMNNKKKAACCKSTSIRCWRHYLDDVETEGFDEALQQIGFKFMWRTLKVSGRKKRTARKQ